MRLVKTLLTSVERLRARTILDMREAVSMAQPRSKKQMGALQQQVDHWRRIASGESGGGSGSTGLEAIARVKAWTKQQMESGAVQWELRETKRGKVWRRVGEPT